MTITYEEAGTNLAPAQTAVTLEEDTTLLTALSSTLRGFVAMLQRSPIVSTVTAIGIAGLSVLAVRRLQRWNRTGETIESVNPSHETEPDPTETANTDTNVSAEELLETAQNSLQTDPQTAILASYAATRTALGADADQTHRELYASHQSIPDESLRDALHTLTTAFEQAAFAAGDIDPTHATNAVEAAEQFLHSETPHQPAE